MELFVQIGIFVLGAPALWFISRPEKWKRWGYILGFLAQPFWYYTVIVNKQYGILFLNICYTYSWCQGIYFYFWRDPNLFYKKNEKINTKD